MSSWISTTYSLPSLPGWYPTLSDWRTMTLHQGAKQWLGTKRLSPCPERIVFFSAERFDDQHAAIARAFDIPEPSSTAAPAVFDTFASAAG